MIGSTPKYGMVIAKNVMLPMRDGVRLATDLYFPALEGAPVAGQFPTILGRTSYDKESPQMWVRPVAEYFVPRGYVVALQDLRGRHQSEGTGQYFHASNPTEGPDGYDTVEWIAAQPWSNGRVGTVGSSHGAIVQQIMALYRPPHLTAIWPDVGPTNYYAHMSREGGAMALHMFGALFLHAHDAQEIRDNPAAKQVLHEAMQHLREWVYQTPFKPGLTPLAVVPNLERMLFNYYYRGEYDEFWAQDCNDQERYFDRHADVPGVYTGGWYDPFAIATTNYFAAMSRQNRTPQRLIMGPWTHYTMRGQGQTWAADVDFGPDSKWGDATYNEERLRWFDRWLKEIPSGVEDDPPVRLFVMGGGTGRRTRAGKLDHGGRWRAEAAWPIARTQPTSFYLRSGGQLSQTPPEESEPPARVAFDPSHPVPTIGGNITGYYELVPLPEGMNPDYVPPRARMRNIVVDGPLHQKEEPGIVGARPPYPVLAARPDVLVFQTPPLPDDVEVTGPIAVTLWISSSAVDTDFTAKLLDVYPPNEDYPGGYHLNLVDSIIRCRYRNGWERQELMTPGEVYRVQIALPPTSNRFQAGHRIRLDISGSSFPRFDVNPNTGEPMGRHTHTVVAHNTVHLDRAHPSHVVLPIIPAT
ncbi:MAG: CocE/NonD family hydrolase [Chloroflexi bacterium]|nr:CocE/NonD family hydrolase [Chloroflexota bacterium]